MTSQIDLLEQMVSVLDRLVDNAKLMKEKLPLKDSQDEVEKLQFYQHEILAELGNLNKNLDSSPPGAPVEQLDEAKARMRDRLQQFQNINKEFFDHVASQGRVIESKKPKRPSSEPT